VSESFIVIPQTYPEKTEGFVALLRQFRADTAQGFWYAWKKPGLRQLFFAAAVLNFFGAPFIVLLPFYVEDFLHARPDWYGFLLAGFGVGSMIGYLVAGAAKFGGRVRSFLMVGALILGSVGFAVFGLLRAPLVSLIAFAIVGVLNGFVNVNIITVLQITTPSEIRGRVFGLLGTLSAGLMPLSMGLTGVVADALGQNVPLIYFACGCTSAVLSLAVSLSSNFREFLGYEASEGGPTSEKGGTENGT
jgi:MFS family permease